MERVRRVRKVGRRRKVGRQGKEARGYFKSGVCIFHNTNGLLLDSSVRITNHAVKCDRKDVLVDTIGSHSYIEITCPKESFIT